MSKENQKNIKAPESTLPVTEPVVMSAAPVEDTRSAKEIAQQKLRDVEQEEKRMVRGKFIYHECPGGIMEFSFRKYKSQPLERFSLKDGEVYTIPLSVARSLNNNNWYPTYTYKNDEAGRPVTSIGERVHRTAFQSLDFY
jgi:hypothetical protein